MISLRLSTRSCSALGSLGPEASIARYAVIGEADRKTLGEYGAVGEMLCNVYDDQAGLSTILSISA